MHNKYLYIGTDGAWKLVWVLMRNHEHMLRKVTFPGRQKPFSQVPAETLNKPPTYKTSKYKYMRKLAVVFIRILILSLPVEANNK